MDNKNNAFAKGLVTAGTTLIKVAIVLIVLIVLITIIPGGSDDSKSKETKETTTEEVTQESTQEQTPEAEPEPEPAAQVFNSDLGTIEFKGLQDMNPYVYVAFMFTNGTGSVVDVYPANMVVNGQYNVTMLGGSSPLAPIEPGNTGAVTFSLALENQTGMTDISQIQTISGDFELHDHANISNTIGYIHFDVVV